MYIMFYFPFIRLHVCAFWFLVCYVFAIRSMVHCRSAFELGASRLPYCCTSICVRSCCTWCASCVDWNKKNKKIECATAVREAFAAPATTAWEPNIGCPVGALFVRPSISTNHRNVLFSETVRKKNEFIRQLICVEEKFCNEIFTLIFSPFYVFNSTFWDL